MMETFFRGHTKHTRNGNPQKKVFVCLYGQSKVKFRRICTVSLLHRMRTKVSKHLCPDFPGLLINENFRGALAAPQLALPTPLVINHHKYMSTMNVIAARQLHNKEDNCLIKKTLKLDCFSAKVWVSRHMKRVSMPYARIKFWTGTKIYHVHHVSLICTEPFLWLSHRRFD